MNLPQMNDMVSVGELADLNKALRKSNTSTTVGYQTTTSGGGGLAALVPQSIEGTLASATYTMKELALWPNIAKTQVTNTVHEYSVIQDHGLDLDPFIAEGGAGITNKSSYERKNLKIKYMAERRECSDVSTLVNVLGANPTMIAEETERGTLRLMQKVERQLFHGDESVNDLGFDGIFKQVETGAPDNVADMAGAEVTPLKLQEMLGNITAAPNFGRPDCIYVEPQVHANLIQQAVTYGRHDQLSQGGPSGLTFGASDLSITGPYGRVPVKQAPFLFTAYEAPAAASHDCDTPVIAQQTVGGSDVDVANTGTGTSKWSGAAGDYIWKIVAVSKEKGYSIPVTTAAYTLADGHKPRIDITANSDFDYFKVYRSAKDGTAATCKFVFDVAAEASGNTSITDLGDVTYNTSKILIAQHDPGVMNFFRLLDFLRRPLAEVATSKPFLLMLFGSPAVLAPKKMGVLKNVAGGLHSS